MNFKEALKGKKFKQTYLYDRYGERLGVAVILEKHFGYSLCSPLDQFNKAKGRYIAYQRALKGYDLTFNPTNWMDEDTWCLLASQYDNFLIANGVIITTYDGSSFCPDAECTDLTHSHELLRGE